MLSLVTVRRQNHTEITSFNGIGFPEEAAKACMKSYLSKLETDLLHNGSVNTENVTLLKNYLWNIVLLMT